MISAAAIEGRRGAPSGRRARMARATGAVARLSPAFAIVALSWVVLVALDATGSAALLHHHALLGGALPLWVGIPLFLLAWLVMVAAMMVPATVPAIRAVTAIGVRAGVYGLAVAFIAGFLAVWAAFGLGAFFGDVVIHRVVDSTPWLVSRPWLIEAVVLAFAGGYQFVPRKGRDLERCRVPREHAISATLRGAAGFGLHHGVACVGASGALMILMFGEGFGGLAWMMVLTVVMVLEATLSSPRYLTAAVGIGLILTSVATLAGSAAF